MGALSVQRVEVSIDCRQTMYKFRRSRRQVTDVVEGNCRQIVVLTICYKSSIVVKPLQFVTYILTIIKSHP